MEEDTAGLYVYLPSLLVKPRRVPPGAENGREAAVELQHKIQIDGLEPDPAIVAFAIERAVSEHHPDHVCEFGSRFRLELVRAPKWSVNAAEPLRELALRRCCVVLLSQSLPNLRIGQPSPSQLS